MLWNNAEMSSTTFFPVFLLFSFHPFSLSFLLVHPSYSYSFLPPYSLPPLLPPSLQRALGTLYSDDVYPEPHLKQPRLIVLPQGDGQEVMDEDLGTTRSSLTSGGSSRRLLEAAGQCGAYNDTCSCTCTYIQCCLSSLHKCVCVVGGGGFELDKALFADPNKDCSISTVAAGLVKRELLSPSEKSNVTSSGSVFSRLDRQSDTPPTLHLSSYASTLSSPPSKRVAVKASPSPQKLSMTITARERRVSDGAGGSSRGGGGRSAVKKEARTLVSSSSGAGKEPLKSRLGVRPKDRRAGTTTSWGGTTSWPEISTSSSAGGSSGRVSGRLGAKHESVPISSKKPKPTMMADSASSPPPKITSRLGTTKPKVPATTAASNSGSSQLRKSKTSSSMVADEYELTRQLDIRSRLAKKEEEMRERRRGPLTGRLGQHQVFKRLT